MNVSERQRLLSIAMRRANPGAGSGATALRERSAVYGTPDLHFLEEHVAFVIVGGLATRLYMPERMTLDTDILVMPGDRPAAETALRGAGAENKGPLTIGGSAWRLSDGRRLDLVAIDEPWTDAAVHTAIRGPDGLPYVTLPYLTLMKLSAGRLQDLADISRMLGAANDDTLKAVIRTVKRYRPQDIEDLENMIQLGKLEY